MPSVLGSALLALLARGPRTGYDLSVHMRRPIGYFWSARHSQIYPELAVLEREGLISHRVVKGKGPRDTKRYRITAAGRRALAEWVTTPYEPAQPKDEFMLRVYAMWTVDPEQGRHVVEADRELHRTAIQTYEQLEAEMRAEHAEALRDPTTPQFYNYATIRRGLSYELHALDWCDWLLSRMTDEPAEVDQT